MKRSLLFILSLSILYLAFVNTLCELNRRDIEYSMSKLYFDIEKEKVEFKMPPSFYLTLSSFVANANKHLRDITYDKHLSLYNNLAKAAYTLEKPTLATSAHDDHIYIRINTFRAKETAYDKIYDVIENTRKPILVDLRGNLGGKERIAYTLYCTIMTKENCLNYDPFEFVKTPFKKYYWKYAVNSNGKKRYNLSLRELDNISLNEEEFSYIGDDDEIELSRDIYVVYDDKCLSACEIFLKIISSHNKAYLVSDKEKKVFGIHRGAVNLISLRGGVHQLAIPMSQIVFKDPSSFSLTIKPRIQVPDLDKYVMKFKGK